MEQKKILYSGVLGLLMLAYYLIASSLFDLGNIDGKTFAVIIGGLAFITTEVIFRTFFNDKKS
jgi:hypothetical protein